MLQQIKSGVSNRFDSDADYAEWLKHNSTTGWVWDWNYQTYIVEKLRQVQAGEIKHLMVSCPPQHGKSQLVTIRYPVYRLLRSPNLRVIVAAYNQSFAEQFSRASRRIAEDAGLALSTERRAVASWETMRGGGLRAVGVGAGVTGNPGDLIVIDDPVKSREEANSQAYRDRCWEWYTNDLYTRLQPDGHVILIMTRWHEDDLAGRIIENSPQDWTVVNLPALALDDDPLDRLPGSALCPDRFDTEELIRRRTLMGSYSFQALYQGTPTPEEGARFRRSWFKYFDTYDEFYRMYGADGTAHRVKQSECDIMMTVDPAATETAQSDFFCASVWAVTPQRDLLLLDVFRERAETTKHETILKNLNSQWKPKFIGVENISYGMNIVQRLLVLGLPVVKLQADRDKVSRSLPIQARYEAGCVYHKVGAPWISDIEDELLHFPLGKHDDFVDTASYAGLHVGQFGEYKPREDNEEEAKDSRKKGSIRNRFGFYDKPIFGTEEYH